MPPLVWDEWPQYFRGRKRVLYEVRGEVGASLDALSKRFGLPLMPLDKVLPGSSTITTGGVESGRSESRGLLEQSNESGLDDWWLIPSSH